MLQEATLAWSEAAFGPQERLKRAGTVFMYDSGTNKGRALEDKDSQGLFFAGYVV